MPPIPVSQPSDRNLDALTRARVPAREGRDGENDACEQPEAVADAEEPTLEERIATEISIWKAHRLHSMEHPTEELRPYTSGVARQMREVGSEDVPVVDHEAVRDTVRLHRARRKARTEHRKRTRRAGIRFWLVLLLLLVASVVLSVTIWHEIQRLFGL